MKNNNAKIYIGLDPGLRGALCAFIEGRIDTIAFEDSDYYKVSDYLDSCLEAGEVVVAIEDVHSMPKQGVASSFKFGFNVGLLHGLLISKAIKFVTVRPQEWQKTVWIRNDKVKTGSKADPKKTSLNAAQRLFPKINLRRNSRCTVPHDGMVDALLICEYARRTNL